jgi:hypothetical protein
MSGTWRFRRPSAAMAVSILALFVALGGVGAVAGGVLTTKKVKKIAKQQVLGLAPGLSVAKAKNADAVGGASLGSLTVGRADNNDGCDPVAASATFSHCGEVDLTLPRSGRVLVNAGATWRSADGMAPNEGTCQIAVDGNVAPGTPTRYGQATAVFNTAARRAGLAINTVTGVLGAGAHAFVLQCNSPVGSSAFADDQMTAVMIGTD